MKSKKKSLFIASTIALVLFVCTTLGVVFNIFIGDARAQGNGEPTLSGGEIEENYILGDVIQIPEAQITCGDETKDAEISIVTPDGERIRSANVKLTGGGVYTAEYKALFNGKAKTVAKTFTVHIPLFSKTSKKTTWEYGVDDSDYQTGKEGVKVTLAKGDTLTYNDIIDLKKSNGQIIDFFLLPRDGIGTKDVKRLVITLTDLYDPKVALTIILQCANDHGDGSNWWYDWTYALAGGQNQTPTGVEAKGTENEKKWVGGDWGSVVPYSFYGTSSNGNGASLVGTQSLNVIYNEEENAVYVGNSEVINLSSLKYFEEPWLGFTNGEVKMTITGENFSLGTADLMITRIGTNNLKNEYFIDDAAPEITVDYAGYDENNLPKAGKGLSYPVFNATALDKVFGEVAVKTTVYYAYESQQRYQINIKDGSFATDAVGEYTIEYVAYDAFKKESKKLVKINCVETTPAITAEAVGDYATSGGTGELILPAEIKYTGGTGVVKTYATATAQSGGDEFVIDGGFRPEKEGVYKIKLYAVDMLGKTATVEYDLTVSINNQPVFIDEPILPKFFLKGYQYTLPTIPAYDYSSGTERKQLETTIAIKDGKNGGEIRDLDSNVTDFEADADGYATVIYKATGDKGSGSAEFKVKVIDAWRDIDKYSIDMKKYFYGENITVTDSKDGVQVSSLADTSYTFVTPVVADGFETKFSITNGGFDCLQLVFEDSKDPSIRFTLELDKSQDQTENSPLKINGVALKYRPWAGFYDKNVFHFVYDEANKTIQSDGVFKTEIVNADKSAFTGFKSGFVYVTVNVIGVDGGAETSWSNFGGQTLSNSDEDRIAPSIRWEDYASKYSINTVAEIHSAIAADVLSPEIYTHVTVKDPTGKIVTSTDGVKLDKVPFDRSYFINLEMYGSYSVKYYAMDWMEWVREYSLSLLVVDDQAPEIALENRIKTEVKQGEEIEISKATATDNVDGAVSVYVYLVNPSGVISRVGETAKLTQLGVYELRYMAFDAFGNLKILYIEITVK